MPNFVLNTRRNLEKSRSAAAIQLSDVYSQDDRYVRVATTAIGGHNELREYPTISVNEIISVIAIFCESR